MVITEQKYLIHKYYVAGTMTLDKCLQVLDHLMVEGITTLKDKINPLQGEQQFYKLKGRSEPLTSSFLDERVDLHAIRQSLADQGIPFAFKIVENGTNLFFRINDQELAKNGLKRVIKEIGKQPINYQKNPKEVTFDEKVVQAKQKIQLQGERSTSINKVKGIQR